MEFDLEMRTKKHKMVLVFGGKNIDIWNDDRLWGIEWMYQMEMCTKCKNWVNG